MGDGTIANKKTPYLVNQVSGEKYFRSSIEMSGIQITRNQYFTGSAKTPKETHTDYKIASATLGSSLEFQTNDIHTSISSVNNLVVTSSGIAPILIQAADNALANKKMNAEEARAFYAMLVAATKATNNGKPSLDPKKAGPLREALDAESSLIQIGNTYYPVKGSTSLVNDYKGTPAVQESYNKTTDELQSDGLIVHKDVTKYGQEHALQLGTHTISDKNQSPKVAKLMRGAINQALLNNSLSDEEVTAFKNAVQLAENHASQAELLNAFNAAYKAGLKDGPAKKEMIARK